MRARETKEKPHLYRHLDFFERLIIHNLNLDGYSLRKIAKTINRAPSTVSRELRRNKAGDKYLPEIAESLYTARKRLYAICFRRPARRGWRYVPGERFPRNQIAWLSDLSKYMRLGKKTLPKRYKEKAPALYAHWSQKPYNFSDLPYYEWILTLEDKSGKHRKTVDKTAVAEKTKQKTPPKTNIIKKIPENFPVQTGHALSHTPKRASFSTPLWKNVA
ncbi:hypothetical protein FUAX_34230 [Fulvitalea axinellae]|uniref:Transposase IS30-like HTH domain-containing protein n=1 Tax=Fulvitalea axinellae TaxID=1182444 RepID=A0AAU9DCU7_9BACT|nr:hypothetical protein FUAX_34230 [Fulvitalea axinellae]